MFLRDSLIFGLGITRDNLGWNFDGLDLSFTLTDSPDDKLTISNFVNSIYRIENFQIEQDLVSMGEIIGSQTWSDSRETNSFGWTAGQISYNGLAGDDTITTGGYDDEIWGNVGNDNLNTGEGNDTLDGGDGDDVLNAGNGENVIYGGNGNDSLSAGSGLDTLDGGADNDTLNGGYGNDVYFGGNGNDILSDSYNNNLSDSDTLDGGEGNDTLRGGGGNDTYIFNRGYGQDLISDYGTYKSAYQAPRTSDGGTSDTLIFGSGIIRNNLRWSFDGADLVFTISVTTQGWTTLDFEVNFESAPVILSQVQTNTNSP